MCQRKVALCDLAHSEHNARISSVHRSTGSLHESQEKKEYRGELGEKCLRSLQIKKGFEKRSDILSCIWQDQV